MKPTLSSLFWSIALFVTKVMGGSLLLTGMVLALIGVARDEDVLSKAFLACSPSERRVFAETVHYGGTRVDPQPNLSGGSCAASLDVSGGPGRLSDRLSEHLGSEGWRINAPSYGGRPGSFSGVLLTATRGRFYIEVSYSKHAGGRKAGSEDRLNVALSKL